MGTSVFHDGRAAENDICIEKLRISGRYENFKDSRCESGK